MTTLKHVPKLQLPLASFARDIIKKENRHFHSPHLAHHQNPSKHTNYNPHKGGQNTLTHHIA